MVLNGDRVYWTPRNRYSVLVLGRRRCKIGMDETVGTATGRVGSDAASRLDGDRNRLSTSIHYHDVCRNTAVLGLEDKDATRCEWKGPKSLSHRAILERRGRLTPCASAARACGAAARPASRIYFARLRRAYALNSSKRGLDRDRNCRVVDAYREQ